MAKGENAGKVTLRHSISLVNFWLTTRCFNTRIVWWSHTLLYPVLGKHNVVAHNCRGLSERGWSWRSDKRGADGRLSGHGRTIEYLGALFGSFAAGAVGLASWHTICGRASFAEVNEKCAYKNSKMRTNEKKWRHEWRISKHFFSTGFVKRFSEIKVCSQTMRAFLSQYSRVFRYRLPHV